MTKYMYTFSTVLCYDNIMINDAPVMMINHYPRRGAIIYNSSELVCLGFSNNFWSALVCVCVHCRRHDYIYKQP